MKRKVRDSRAGAEGAPAGVRSRAPMPVMYLRVKVKPGARVSSLEQVSDGTWVAKLKAPPIDGKANDELVTLVAKRFGCLKTSVAIKAGAGGRMKLIRIEIP